MKKWGSGIPRLLRECSEYGLPEPEFIDFDGDFRVNMYRQIAEKDWPHTDDTKRDTNDTISENDTKILSLIRENPSITQIELKENCRYPS